MKDFLLNENFSMMDIPSDHLIPLDSTGVTIMSRTLKLTFNIENKTFEAGYLNYEQNTKEVRNKVVHNYYLSIDTRLSYFIVFLAEKYPEQASQAKINNVRQIKLKVTITPQGLTYYNLIITGDTTGIMTFTPSEFKDYQREVNVDVSSLEPLINSIIHEEEEEVNQLLSFYVYDSANQSRGFGVQYKDYEYFKTRGYHVYDVVLDLPFFGLLDFLRVFFPSKNKVEGEIEEVYLRINEKKQIASLLLYGKDTDVQEYERIDFIPTLLKDLGDESRNLPQFSIPQNSEKQVIEKPDFLAFNSEIPNTYQQVISVCREIVDMSDQTAEKINKLKDLLK